MKMIERDRDIVRGLAERAAEIAALPAQQEKKRLWRALNGLKPERPMVAIDQVCWEEMDMDGSLALKCEDPDARGYERDLRRMLYQWERFPADMVAEPFAKVPKAITNTGFGMEVDEQTRATSEITEVLSHKYGNQFRSIADVEEKIKMPSVTHDAAETGRRMEYARWLFGGAIGLRSEGADTYLSLWDPISTWMGVEAALYAIIDNPDMIRALLSRMVAGYMSMLDQLESQGLLCASQQLVHCTGAYTDELPAPGYSPDKPRTKDLWMFGLAQMLATVSPTMFLEYEIEYMAPIFERFGLVYYGCCDPLDGKMAEVRRIPHLRKISMSPWANRERGAREIGSSYVFSNKPNPAFLASGVFDEDLIRRDLMETKSLCERHGCPLEFILKDISTLRGKPERLWRWSEIAMEVACS
ncbi:MAG: hypothetical protein LBJ10_01000 [Clostridiales bacterium]|jgi:hypothetical protein|nr:hypothetical protein [Clostridiales bacterium]